MTGHVNLRYFIGEHDVSMLNDRKPGSGDCCDTLVMFIYQQNPCNYPESVKLRLISNVTRDWVLIVAVKYLL
jgi:hypothetical protein